MRRATLLGPLATLLLAVAALPASAEEDLIVSGASEAAAGLDLKAVAEVFRTSDNPEAFERALNDPDVGVNNLDLNDDGEVDYLRVLEEVEGDTHVFVVQASLAENEYQDVATVELEPGDDEDYRLQVHGSAVLYGPNYYVVPPPGVRIGTWPIVTFVYHPAYRPWRSVVYWGAYPRWWRPWRPVHVTVYRARPVHVHRHVSYSVTHTTHVHTAGRVYTRPTSSAIVTRKAGVARTKDGTTAARGVSRTRTTAAGNEVERKRAVKRTVDADTGDVRTVRGAGRTVTDPETGQSRTVRAGGVRQKDGATGEVTTKRKAGVRQTDPATGKTAKKSKSSKKAKDKKPKKKKKPGKKRPSRR